MAAIGHSYMPDKLRVSITHKNVHSHKGLSDGRIHPIQYGTRIKTKYTGQPIKFFNLVYIRSCVVPNELPALPVEPDDDTMQKFARSLRGLNDIMLCLTFHRIQQRDYIPKCKQIQGVPEIPPKKLSTYQIERGRD